MTARLFINKFLNEKMGSLLFCYKGYRRVILACSVCVIRKAHMGSLLGVGR